MHVNVFQRQHLKRDEHSMVSVSCGYVLQGASNFTMHGKTNGATVQKTIFQKTEQESIEKNPAWL